MCALASFLTSFNHAKPQDPMLHETEGDETPNASPAVVTNRSASHRDRNCIIRIVRDFFCTRWKTTNKLACAAALCQGGEMGKSQPIRIGHPPYGWTKDKTHRLYGSFSWFRRGKYTPKKRKKSWGHQPNPKCEMCTASVHVPSHSAKIVNSIVGMLPAWLFFWGYVLGIVLHIKMSSPYREPRHALITNVQHFSWGPSDYPISRISWF